MLSVPVSLALDSEWQTGTPHFRTTKTVRKLCLLITIILIRSRAIGTTIYHTEETWSHRIMNIQLQHFSFDKNSPVLVQVSLLGLAEQVIHNAFGRD